MPKLLAFSGSPIKGGSIESAMYKVLESSGLEFEFIRLADIKMEYCLACKKCAEENRCIIPDDINGILEKIEQADGIIFGAFPSYGAVNAMMKVFIERLWPLRHRKFLTKNKVSAAIVSGIMPDSLAEYFENYCVNYLGTKYQGLLTVSGNAPCLSCGYGETCPASAFTFMYGAGEKIKSEHFNNFDSNDIAIKSAEELGKKLAQAIVA